MFILNYNFHYFEIFSLKIKIDCHGLLFQLAPSMFGDAQGHKRLTGPWNSMKCDAEHMWPHIYITRDPNQISRDFFQKVILQTSIQSIVTHIKFAKIFFHVNYRYWFTKKNVKISVQTLSSRWKEGFFNWKRQPTFLILTSKQIFFIAATVALSLL